jgi:hypothetical protein
VFAKSPVTVAEIFELVPAQAIVMFVTLEFPTVPLPFVMAQPGLG